jgi:hypothetical protein
MDMNLRISLAALLSTACAASGPASPDGEQAKPAPTADEIARELANPTSAVAAMNVNIIRRAYDGNLPGASDQDSTSILFQPGLPFPQENGYNVLFRPAIPILFDQPVFDPATGTFDDDGLNLGDTAFDLAYGTTTKGGTLMLGGIVGSIPTATDSNLGTDQWTLGPEVLTGMLRKWGLVGILASHQWDFAGEDAFDTNLTSGQYFYALTLSDGWIIGAGPTWSYNHEVASDQAWTIPLGVGINRTVIIAGRPWKFGLEYWDYVESPDAFGPEWELRIKIAPVVRVPW